MVLTAQEVKQVMVRMSGVARVVVKVPYGGGLRLLEGPLDSSWLEALNRPHQAAFTAPAPLRRARSASCSSFFAFSRLLLGLFREVGVSNGSLNERLVPADSQSRRDCVLQPNGVARNELPWEIVQTASQPQRGCGRA